MTISPGIETDEQVYYLKTLNCDYGQGYLYSKPVDTDQADLLITQNIYTGGTVTDFQVL